MKRILIIEDDKVIQNSVKYYLENEGFKLDCASSLTDGEQMLIKNEYDLLLLDVSFRESNGFDFYKHLDRKIPTIFLTALDDEKDIVKGFELGANDYITKPFHARELLMRIKNVLKYTENKKESYIKIENLLIDTDKSIVYSNDKKIELTALEYKILLFISENKGKLVTRGQILASIWDNNNNFVNDNTLTVYIKRLREKIELDCNNPKIIKTVRGIGYRIGE